MQVLPASAPLMDPAESPAAVARLLGLLAGVEVQNVWQRGLEVTMRVRVDSIDSLSRIDQHATFANMHRLTIRRVGPPAPLGAAANPLEATFAATHDRQTDGAPTQLEIFGIFLARDLKALGRLPADEADRLQRGWKAVVL